MSIAQKRAAVTGFAPECGQATRIADWMRRIAALPVPGRLGRVVPDSARRMKRRLPSMNKITA